MNKPTPKKPTSKAAQRTNSTRKVSASSTQAESPPRKPVTHKKADRYEYDVCLSFAGEDRKYVERVAKSLKAKAVRVFYDSDEEARLWGTDLYVHLDDVYRNQSRYCVVFVSASYKVKLWTNHERQSIQARAFASKKEYLLPARFDDTDLPGLRPTVGYTDLRHKTPAALAKLIIEKLAADDPTDVRFSVTQRVTSKPKAISTSTIAAPAYPRGKISSSGAWVMLDDAFYLTESVEEPSPDTVEVRIPPRNSKEEAQLRGLDPGPYRNARRIGYAHGNEAALVEIGTVRMSSQSGKVMYTLTLRAQRNDSGIEIGYNGLSADDIANMRARLIMLNEKPLRQGIRGEELLAGFISAPIGGVEIKQGALPDLWSRFYDQPTHFLRWARLYAVYLLKTTGTVERVEELTLGPVVKGTVSVKFTGTRPTGYSARPAAITVSGTCPLGVQTPITHRAS